MSNKKLIPEQVRKIKDAYWQQMNVLNGHDELDDAIDNYVSFLESQLKDKKPSRKTRIAELEVDVEHLNQFCSDYVIRIEELTDQNEALITNAFKTYKNPNPNLPRFDMAMSAITSERDGRAASDSLWKDYKERNTALEAAYSKLLDQAESMSVMMQCPWKEGSHAEVAWRKEQDKIFNEFWDDDEVNAREAFKEKT
jgi:hypothetical protein